MVSQPGSWDSRNILFYRWIFVIHLNISVGYFRWLKPTEKCWIFHFILFFWNFANSSVDLSQLKYLLNQHIINDLS
jgi:hypothetical protein